MPSRRTVIMGALAARFASAAKAEASPAGTAGGNTGPQAVLQLQRRSIEVNGKPASVFGIRQPDGTFGITTDVGKPFRVQVENQIDEPSLIHWHGLTPPWQQDGVPGISGPRSRLPAAPSTTSRSASAAPFGCTRTRGCRSSR